ncbi:MAG: hypothetical protein AB1324_04255 [Candidatus Micrarchaeota archaeon]
MRAAPKEERFLKKTKARLAKILSAAVLAASIFGAKEAKADEPAPERPRVEHTYSLLGGMRLSRSPGISIDLPNQSIGYSGFSYHLGDEDFRMRLDGRDVGVIGFLENFDYTDARRFGELLSFGLKLKENLGVTEPGSYSHDIRTGFRGFAEGYGRYDHFSDAGRATNEVAVTGYAFARGRAFFDIDIDYDNPALPLRLDSRMRGGFGAEMRSSLNLGMESSGGPVGFGVLAQDYSHFRSFGTVDAEINYNLLSGFHADMRTFFWKRRIEGSAFLPYLTLDLNRAGLRLHAEAGPDVRIETEEGRAVRHHGFADFPGERGSERERQEYELSRIRVLPAASLVLAFGNPGAFFPVLSFSNREAPVARGAFGLHVDRAFLSASADTAQNASGELLILADGTMERREHQDYVFRNETAAAGFFPAYRTRMMLNRHRLITSSPKLLFRSALSYEREISELSAENGFVLSRGNFYMDSGVRIFSAESFGAGIYNSIGTRDFFTTQSFTSTIGGGPQVQTVMLSVGGTFR